MVMYDYSNKLRSFRAWLQGLEPRHSLAKPVNFVENYFLCLSLVKI